MALDLEAMNREALAFCHEMKAKFPDFADKDIGRVAKFAVMSKHALRHATAGLPEGMTLSPAGVEMVLTECGKSAFEKGK